MKDITEDFIAERYDVFRMFNERWGLVTAGTPEDFNTMTIGWGSLGTIWGPPMKGKAIVTVYLRESRYTTEYMKKNDLFTVSFFPEEFRRDLGYLGSHSGRDGNKVAATRLTPERLGGSVGFKQAELTFVCKKLSAMLITDIPDDVRASIYADGDLHYAFIGEIISVWQA